MNLLLDTNILILLAKDHQQKLIGKINPENRKTFISVASIGELKSIAMQNAWGLKKWNVINGILDEAIIIEINENLIDTYTQIDAYSQLLMTVALKPESSPELAKTTVFTPHPER